VENQQQFYTFKSYGNLWDTDYPSGGNYWSNYAGVDTDNDGIGDEPHTIDTNNTDRYPLMAPISIFDAGAWNGTVYNINLVSNSSVSNVQLEVTQKMLSFNVTGSEFSTGFCRVTIPNVIIQDLWQGDYTVLVNGEESLMIHNWTDVDNTYIYFTYQHSEHEVVIISEFSSLIVLPLLMIATLLAVIVYRRKHTLDNSAVHLSEISHPSM
jgi:hypothetical protein